MDSLDHKQIGQKLRLFHFQEEAPGMVFWHPAGLVLVHAMEDAIRRRIVSDGFVEVGAEGVPEVQESVLESAEEDLGSGLQARAKV
jgi:threonyl-tRNA synthetase